MNLVKSNEVSGKEKKRPNKRRNYQIKVILKLIFILSAWGKPFLDR